jgi:glutamyl-tRNA reductase
MDGNPLSKLRSTTSINTYARGASLSSITHSKHTPETQDILSKSIMVVVAIAGGSGNLGRALVDALKAKGGSEVIVLARKVSPRQAELS